MAEQKTDVFSNMSVPKAVLRNVIPAIAAMMMVLIYNLADTFFIGQTKNDLLIAAVSVSTPVFLIFMAIGTVFGVGGTSVISRALGEGKHEHAKRVCSFCMWACVGVGVLMTVGFLIFMNPILTAAGAKPETWEPPKTYLTIVSCGGVFVLISNCFSNILRAEGQAGKAMMGQIIGNLLNVILDPIMILLFDWGIAGAAIATVIGNAVGAGYYILYFIRGKSTLSIRPKDFFVRDGICKNVLAIGIPASLGSLLMSVSQIIVNNQMSEYDNMAVAGMGVAMKVTMITGMACIGTGQGVQPLLGYCVGAKLWERFKKIMKFSLIFALGLSVFMTALGYMFTGQIVKAFLSDQAAYDYAVQFARILLTTSVLFGIFYVLCNALQAMGAATASLIVNLSRQGLIYIPALFILQYFFELNGLVWAQPVADVLSMALVILLYLRTLKRMQQAPVPKIGRPQENVS